MTKYVFRSECPLVLRNGISLHFDLSNKRSSDWDWDFGDPTFLTDPNATRGARVPLFVSSDVASTNAAKLALMCLTELPNSKRPCPTTTRSVMRMVKPYTGFELPQVVGI